MSELSDWKKHIHEPMIEARDKRIAELNRHYATMVAALTRVVATKHGAGREHWDACEQAAAALRAAGIDLEEGEKG